MQVSGPTDEEFTRQARRWFNPDGMVTPSGLEEETRRATQAGRELRHARYRAVTMGLLVAMIGVLIMVAVDFRVLGWCAGLLLVVAAVLRARRGWQEAARQRSFRAALDAGHMEWARRWAMLDDRQRAQIRRREARADQVMNAVGAVVDGTFKGIARVAPFLGFFGG